MTRKSMPVEMLEARRLFSVPSISDLATYSVPIGKTIQIPLSTTYDGADTVVYSIKASNRAYTATLHPSTNTFVEIDIAGYSDPMVFELFNDAAPKTVSRFTGLVNAGFYNGLTFHRVVKNFVIQGGDPSGDGSGGPQFTFDDEFNASDIFSGTGQLAMSNDQKDDNGSQFFVTEGPQRLLDFNHTIFGQIVRGEDTHTAITNIDTDGDDRPVDTVTISQAKIITDTTDAVLEVKALSSALTPGTFRVTATTAEGASTRTLNVDSFTDTINDPPIMGSTQALYYTPVNTTFRVRLTASDLEGDTPYWDGARVETQGLANGIISQTGMLTVTPVAGFVGIIKLMIGVREKGAQSRGSMEVKQQLPLDGIDDEQVITVAVGETPISPTTYALDAVGGVALVNTPVGMFKDADLTQTASDFKASIDWGDGTVTDGTVFASARAGTYSVLGSKSYGTAASGVLPLSVTITNADGVAVSSSATATIRNYASIANGILTVYGTSGNDRFGISRKGAYYAASVNGQTKAFAVGDVTQLNVYALAGRDRITIAPEVVVPAYLEMGDGNDTVYGGGGPEVINAGAGNDYVVCGDGGGNRVAGGDGNDTLTGGAGRDRLFGGNGNDVVYGAAGRDIVSGDAGNDTILGGTSNDTLYGGDGDDLLNGMGGADFVYGGLGFDKAKKDPADDYGNDVEAIVP